jgi:ABC-2 type transport system permease protein
MLTTIALKEIRSALRDIRFVLLSVFVFGLLLTAAVVGWQSYRQIQDQRQKAQTLARKNWLNQGDKNPHSAAHYGSFAFRPKSSLSFLDFGTDTYTGTSVQLEAHKQNDILFSQAQDATSLLRFGEMTTAFVLQSLLPLLIIFLGFNAFTQEREDNTLKILLSQGVSLRQIALGKVLGLAALLALILLPIVLVVSGLWSLSGDFAFNADWALRGSLLLGIYALYFLIFITLTVAVSVNSTNSRNSLLTLLGVWIFACVLLPKATANIGANLYPSPSKFAFDKALREDEEKGIDGHNPSDKRFDVLKSEYLKKYGADSLEKLPINFDGIAMQEGEKYSSMIYNKHFGNVKAIFQKQNQVSEIVALLNPYLAMRQLSMGLSGSDYVHYVDFQQKAEAYRFNLVKTMNDYHANNSKYGDWEFTADEKLWSKLPDFKYESPQFSSIAGKYSLAAFALIGWASVLLGVLGFGLLNKKI